jgi:hypothetical protein
MFGYATGKRTGLIPRRCITALVPRQDGRRPPFGQAQRAVPRRQSQATLSRERYGGVHSSSRHSMRRTVRRTCNAITKYAVLRDYVMGVQVVLPTASSRRAICMW